MHLFGNWHMCAAGLKTPLFISVVTKIIALFTAKKSKHIRYGNESMHCRYGNESMY